MVENRGSVGSGEATGLDPGVGEVNEAIDSEEQHSARGRHQPTLMTSDEPEGLEVVACQLPRRGKELGSCSEVDRFRVQRRKRLLIE